MDIQQTDNETRGKFFIETDNEVLAEMTYTWAGTDRIIIDHTDVSPKLKGQGAGKQMVAKAVEFARLKHIKIIPLCPFARSVFEKESAFKDVL